MTAAQRYATVHTASADPDTIVIDLHARVVADLRNALVHLRAGRRGSAIADLRHARRVFLFLNRTLDVHADPYLAGDLHQTYVWALRTLEEGGPDAVGRVLAIADRLHRAWTTAGEHGPDG